MEIIIVLLLLVVNGVFAMAEIAIVSARKSKLAQLAQEGSKNAQAALELAQSPNRFLSTVQIGITFVGIFAGAYGGETIAVNLGNGLKSIPVIAPYSEELGLFIVVAVITYFSLIIGELVPKRLALNNPEKIASLVARPMNTLSSITSPLVSLLGISTEVILRVLGMKPNNQPTVSEEEVRMLIREGARVGIFNLAEKDIVERTLRLGDKKLNTLMTPRKEIVWLDADSSFKTLRSKIAKNPRSHFPVCGDSLDKVIGVVRTEDLLTEFLVEGKIDLKKSLQKPLFVPENMEALKVLELFKKSGIHMALIINEYGSVLGLLSLTDVLEEIVGDIPALNELEEQEIMKREDGSFLVDGLVSIDEFKEHFHIQKLPGEHSGAFHTIGGFVMNRLGRIPVLGDNFDLDSYYFEVMDMDGNRIDKILIKSSQKKKV